MLCTVVAFWYPMYVWIGETYNSSLWSMLHTKREIEVTSCRVSPQTIFQWFGDNLPANSRSIHSRRRSSWPEAPAIPRLDSTPNIRTHRSKALSTRAEVKYSRFKASFCGSNYNRSLCPRHRPDRGRETCKRTEGSERARGYLLKFHIRDKSAQTWE